MTVLRYALLAVLLSSAPTYASAAETIRASVSDA
jgi:hypothetical protein